MSLEQAILANTQAVEAQTKALATLINILKNGESGNVGYAKDETTQKETVKKETAAKKTVVKEASNPEPEDDLANTSSNVESEDDKAIRLNNGNPVGRQDVQQAFLEAFKVDAASAKDVLASFGVTRISAVIEDNLNSAFVQLKAILGVE